MSLDALGEAAERHALSILGTCHTIEEDGLGCGTLALLGPAEPGFWDHVTRMPEFTDDRENPLDRWSKRVITELAKDVCGAPLFPFGTPPRPFIGWALRSGRAWVSPVGLLVHDVAGLLVSYRGAVLFDEEFDLPGNSRSPCDDCARPCLMACPVGALTPDGYSLAACHSFLDEAAGVNCLSAGCQVRRVCPISRTYPRNPSQSAFHMAAFHPSFKD